MVRIFGIIIVGLLALSIGLGTALFKTRTDARVPIYKLQEEIQTRTTFGGNRRGGGDSDGGNRGPRGQGDFRAAQERLNLSDAQVEAFRGFLKERRNLRRSMAEEIRGSTQAFREALSGEEVDVDRLRGLRQDFAERRAQSNNEAFERFEAFLLTLSPEQRAAMVELTKGNPNSLLFL